MDPSLKISRVALLFALFLFIFPFVHLSCQGQQIVSVTGLQLITGTEMEGQGRPGAPKRESDGEVLALLALLFGAAAAVFAFVKVSKATLAMTVASGVAGLCLFLLKLRIDNVVFRESEGIIKVSYGFAFWLAFLIYVGGCGYHVYRMRQKSAVPATPARTEPVAPA